MMEIPARPELAGLAIADPPERWGALGFAVEDGVTALGRIEIRFTASGTGITGWTLRNVAPGADIDGLGTTVTTARPPPEVEHANGSLGLDHVVILTPDFDRTVAALAARGLALRRVRDPGGYRQGFRRLGPAIMEIVEAPGHQGGASFWGLVVVVGDLDALAERLAPHVGDPRPAVQPGRHIATLAASAGLSVNLAFMDAEAHR